jgi:hypothetical protein
VPFSSAAARFAVPLDLEANSWQHGTYLARHGVGTDGAATRKVAELPARSDGILPFCATTWAITSSRIGCRIGGKKGGAKSGRRSSS